MAECVRPAELAARRGPAHRSPESSSDDNIVVFDELGTKLENPCVSRNVCRSRGIFLRF